MGPHLPSHFQIPSEASRQRATSWGRRTRPLLRRLGARYGALTGRRQIAADISLHLLGPFLIGLALYVPLAIWEPTLLSAWYAVLVLSLLGTALVIALECAHALRAPAPPLAEDALSDEELPTIGIVVSAYLANEADTVLESLHKHLAMDYPTDKLVVVCAYNCTGRLEVERELTELASHDPRFVALRVEGSTSKAHNINAALDHLAGEVDLIGFFDADHHPLPCVARRAARWLSDAAGDDRADAVQGQCVIRNVDASGVSRTVAAEFATIYAVSHPGRTSMNGFGIFGGSNGFWRSEVIDALGMDPEMLTEDIDVTSRALLQGHRIVTDRGMVATELAPESWSALWRQRVRWAQGWWEVSQRHSIALLRSEKLTGTQKRGVALLYIWRVLHPWLAVQMWPLVVALLLTHGIANRDFSWGVPIFVLTSVVTLGTPVLQCAVARRVSPPGLREDRGLFLRFGLVTMLYYAEFKAIVNRAAMLRDLLGVHEWTVTPRDRRPTAQPAGRHAHNGPLTPALAV